MASQFLDLPIENFAAGVASLNGLTGALTLVGGTGITVTPSGSTITIASTTPAGITQLTGDVTAGPGSGSQVASLVATTNGTLTSLTALTSAPSLGTVGTITTGVWNGTTIAIAHGGTSQTTAPAARGPNGLNIDERTTVNAISYAAVSTDRYIAQIGTMSGGITITLPLASSVNPGQSLFIADESGTVSTTNTITVASNGSDTIDGSANKSIRSAYGYMFLWSNGTNMWFTGVERIGGGGTGLSTTPTNGQLLVGNTSTNSYNLTTLTGSSSISVTNGAGSITLAVPASGISYSNIQNESADTLLGNPTGSPAAPSEITLYPNMQFTGTQLRSRVPFAAVTAPGTATSSTSATSIFTGATIGFGSLTIPANSFKLGSTLRVELYGTFSNTTGSPTLEIEFSLINQNTSTRVIIGDLVQNIGASTHTGFSWTTIGNITDFLCNSTGASGTVQGFGALTLSGIALTSVPSGTTTGNTINTLPPAAVTIDTTAAQLFDVRFKWSTGASGANTIQLLGGAIYID